MSFLSPIFLFAMAAVGLPLIIHLLNLKRPQKIRFSTLAFFKELQKTTIRKIRIKRYLLLILRLLAIVCLAIVLARPFLPPGSGNGMESHAPSLNAILIDNSISMSRIGEKGPLFEQARDIIKSIEESSKDSDRFIFQVTNGGAEYNTIIGHNQLLRRVEEAELISSGNYAGNRINGLLDVLEEAPYENKRLFIISDGQRSQFSEALTSDRETRTISTTFINLGDVEVQNTMITSLESSTNMIGTGLPVKLEVNVFNEGGVPVSNQYVSLEFEGELVGQYSVSLEPESGRVYSFEVIPSGTGSSNGKIFIEGDEFTLDNDYFFSIQVPETRKILWVRNKDTNRDLINYTEVMLQASGDNDAQLSYTEAGIEILGTSDISNFDAIVLDGLSSVPEFAFSKLLEFVQGGKGVVFFPSETGNIQIYNEFLKQFNAGSFTNISGDYTSFKSIAKASRLQEDHPVFAGLFDLSEEEELRVANPDIYYYLRFKPSASPGGFNILELNNNDPLVREKRFGEGRLIISAIGNDPGWSNFAVKPLFAPLYYRTLLYAASSDEGGFDEHILGTQFQWTGNLNLSSSVLKIGEEEIIPETEVTPAGTKLEYPAEDWSPGWVSVSDGEHTYSVAVNLSRSESEFIQLDENEDETRLGGLAFVDAYELGGESLQNEIKASGFGREIWSWFMLAGLFFLVLESLVSVFYKAETIN